MTDPGHRRGRVDQHSLGKHVRAFSAAGHEYTHGEGKVIAYAPQPSVTIESADGTRFSWMAHLCEVIPSPDPPLAEPGIWGVVEAACVHSEDRQKWYHNPDGNWWPVMSYGDTGQFTNEQLAKRLAWPDDWDSLIDPVLIRPGIDPAPEEEINVHDRAR